MFPLLMAEEQVNRRAEKRSEQETFVKSGFAKALEAVWKYCQQLNTKATCIKESKTKRQNIRLGLLDMPADELMLEVT